MLYTDNLRAILSIRGGMSLWNWLKVEFSKEFQNETELNGYPVPKMAR